MKRSIPPPSRESLLRAAKVPIPDLLSDAALGQVVLTNPSARRVGASTVELPVGEGLAAFRVPRLGAGESHEEPFTIPTRRRGVVVATDAGQHQQTGAR